MKKYSELLKDPRWQKKRLEIFSRDEFICRSCLRADLPLHAHHVDLNYEIEPLNHDSKRIITLCEQCHEIWHSVFNLPYETDLIISVAILARKIEIEEVTDFITKNLK